MDSTLATSIANLYSVFADYRLESPAPCSTCYPPDEVLRIERKLRTTPLGALTLDDLSHFYTDGVLTWGDANDFRHLLPRLMELFAAHHLGERVDWHGDPIQLALDLGPDLALLRFVDAEWWSWPDRERDVVEAFFFSFWCDYLDRFGDTPLDPGAWLEEDLLEAILRLVPTVSRYLEHWRAAGWTATRHLAWFIANDAMTSWLIWQDAKRPTTMGNWELVRSWLDEPPTREQLEQAARQSAPRALAWEAVLGLEVLDRGRADIKFWDGEWIPDERSAARARDLGVKLPDSSR